MTLTCDLNNEPNFLDASNRPLECVYEDNSMFKPYKCAVLGLVPVDHKYIGGAWRSPEWIEENFWDGF